ncbi:MAG: hypothetical protein ACK4GK_17455 [Ferrovibrio sp.]
MLELLITLIIGVAALAIAAFGSQVGSNLIEQRVRKGLTMAETKVITIQPGENAKPIQNGAEAA